MKKKILVIDVGGSNVKVMISRAQRRKFKSGPEMTPRELVSSAQVAVAGLDVRRDFDGVSGAGSQWLYHERAEASWGGLDTIQF